MAGTNTTGGMPPPMAAGGTTGQVLTKKSDTSYDTEWTTPAGGGGTVTDVTASAPLASTGGATPDITIGGGTAGQVLTSDGGTSPTWEDLPAPPTVPDASDATPQSIGTAAAGVSADYSRADHVHDGSLGDLDDVSATAPSAGQVLTWGGAEWAPATPATVPSASSSTPQGIGTAAVGVSTDYARADHVHAGTVAALTDRTTELPWQSYTEFAHASSVAATPTRDIQAAIDATTAGPAWQVIIGPGSYGGGSLTTVTIPAGRNNISLIGPVPQEFGGTQVDLSSGRGLTIGNNVVRARVVGLQIEGMTTIDTTGAGVHRLERSQLVGGLTIGAISGTIYIVGCAVGNVSINAGFTGSILFDRCLFTGTYTNGTLPTRVLISDCAGLATAPTTSAILNGRFQIATGLTTYYANGTALLGAPLTAINGLTPAADRIAYYTGASTGALATLTTFGRSLIDDVDASAARSTLGLGTAATQNSTAFQPADATLTALAGVSTAANKLAYFTGVDTAAATDITTAGREILSTATSGTSGQVLTSSGGGAPTWTTVSGGGGTISGTIAANEVAFGTGVDSIGGSANLEWNNSTSVLSIVGDAADCLTVASAIDGQFLAVSPTAYTLTITDPLTPTSSAMVGPSDVAVGDGSQSGNVRAGAVDVNDVSSSAQLKMSVPAGVATLTSQNSATLTPEPLNVVCDELQVNGDAGTSGYVLTSNGAGAAPTWQAAGGGGGGGALDVQAFTISGTWTKPVGAQFVEVIAVGGGGGGGSGRLGAAASTRGGGAGGGGAGITRWMVPAAALAGTVAVTVGAGGAGGAPILTSGVNGNAGSPGTASTFGGHVYAAGGAGGAGGAGTTAPVGGSGATASILAGGNGGNGGAGATGGPTVGASALGAAGGGGGGSITSGNTAQAGASGGAGSPFLAGASALAGGAGGAATGVNGSAGTASTSSQPFGGGGGGGGGANHVASGSAIGGTGGAGGSYGAGGGGGGAGTTSTTSGQSGEGGAGASGIVYVITY